MARTFYIHICHTHVVSVEAESKQEAERKYLDGEGEHEYIFDRSEITEVEECVAVEDEPP